MPVPSAPGKKKATCTEICIFHEKYQVRAIATTTNSTTPTAIATAILRLLLLLLLPPPLLHFVRKYAQKPGLADQSRDYLMSAHVITKSRNSRALGVPLLACTRRAGPETGPGVLVCLYP